MLPSRVVELSYVLEAGETMQRWDFTELFAESIYLSDFDCRVEGMEVTVRPLADFADEKSARAALEPRLADWAAVIELDLHVPLTFRFAGARVQKQRETESTPVLYSVGREIGLAWDVAEVDAKLRELPLPSPFADSADLRVIRERLREYRVGRERLLALGYYAYTAFTRRYGGSKNVPTAMRTEPTVLDTLNDLTSNRSSAQHERKSRARKPPLTQKEQVWIEAAIVALIKQAGAIDAGARPETIRMDDLPSL